MRLMSACAIAMSAAINAVITPIHTTIISDAVTPLIAPSEKIGYTRATRNTPAATIVAAWISAETGVGPSIASGNQTCRGNCADFPTAPQKIRRAAAVRKPGFMVRYLLDAISVKTTEPDALQTIRMPSMKPKSPMRLVMNAFLAASAADGRLNQWPIRRYELTPTNSQKMNIITKLFASTIPSIANIKRDRDAK